MPRRENAKRTTINHIVVTGYEKKKQPSKHFVFVIDLIWDNDERYEVLRRYSEFFTLNETLKLVFPSSKNTDPSLTIPKLPSRKFFGRSHVEKVAEARVESINSYCQSLVRLDPKISQSKHVMAFLSPKIGDRTLPKLRLHRPATLHPQMRPAGNTVWEDYCVVAAFQGEGPNQISAQSGDQVRVINKDNTGWWFVERRGKVGWIPESYLKKSSEQIEKEDFSECVGLLEIDQSKSDASNLDNSGSRENSPGLEVEAQDYKAIDSFTANEPGQLSFDVDDIITVLDKMEDGWWFVAKGKNEGWVPCGYLEPLSQEQDTDSISEGINENPTEKYRTMASYTADEEDEISFSKGSIATVMHKSLTGWWMVNCEGKTGLAPATYLKIIDDDEVSVSKDSGVETDDTASNGPSPLAAQKSFKQSPRQHTVRKKRSRKGPGSGGPRLFQTITEDDQGDSKKNRKMSDSPLYTSKNESASRKHSTPESSPRSSPRSSVKQLIANTLNVGGNTLTVSGGTTPPRPRQTLIKRAYDTPEDDRPRRNLSPSRKNDERSPSPVRRGVQSSPQHNRRQFKGSNEKLNETGETTIIPPSAPPTASPTAQQTADTIIKYILASSDPELKSALIKIVSSDPQIAKALKK